MNSQKPTVKKIRDVTRPFKVILKSTENTYQFRGDNLIKKQISCKINRTPISKIFAIPFKLHKNFEILRPSVKVTRKSKRSRANNSAPYRLIVSKTKLMSYLFGGANQTGTLSYVNS